MTYNSSSNADPSGDSSQRILDQYPKTEHDQGAQEKERNKPYLKGHERSKVVLKEIRRRYPHVFDALLLLSRHRTIYIGYYGYGATYLWRRQGQKEGTIYITEKLKGQVDQLGCKILENLAYEGSIFASYDSLMEHLKEEGLLGSELCKGKVV